MKHQISLTIIVLLCILTSQAETKKPNIVFFLVDDMGWQDCSLPFYKEETQLNRDYYSPNLEQLAKDGLLFSNAYACAICSPSRVSLMTGQNAARHKVTCWTLRKDKSPEQGNKKFQSPPWNLNGLQPVGAGVERSVEAQTLPGLLRQAGYHTIHAGKAHFGTKDTPGADPKNLGFDTNIAGSYMGGPGSYYGDNNFSADWRGGGKIWDVPGLEKYHGQKINLTEAITREVIIELEKVVAAKKPFYLYLSHYAIHAPWEPDRRFLKKYEDKGWSMHKAKYASMIESMDRSLGDVRTSLKKLGVADNTIIVFMSDNGSPKQCPQNKPLRGHKISGYEGGARVPMVVYWPGVTPAGKRTGAQVIIEDIFSSLLEIGGAKNIPENDGKSFIPVLKKPERATAKRPLFWHYPNFYDQPPFSSIRYGNLKLIYWHSNEKIELFDLVMDIGEKNNIAKSNPEKTKQLVKILADHLRKTKAQMPINRELKKTIPFPDQLF